MNVLGRIWLIVKREIVGSVHRPLFFYTIFVAPLLCIVFFTTMMYRGMPTRLPCAVVDLDNTPTSRKLCRIIDALEMSDVRYKFSSVDEAHKALRRGVIYGYFYLPKSTTSKVVGSRQPMVSFYTNEAFMLPANMLMKDLKTSSELIGLALTREQLRGKGVPENRIMAQLRPIIIETHPIGNPVLDYSVYLSNILVPGLIILLVMLGTVYTLGIEWKKELSRQLYRLSGNSTFVALTGKLLPQTIVFFLIVAVMDVCFFCILKFPCKCGFSMMLALGFLSVLAAQGFGVFMFGMLSGMMRMALCICTLWGILSFSLAGFTFPVTAMDPVLQALASWFPLRHYYLIYVSQALDGYPIQHVWNSVVWLVAFTFLPLLVIHRYKQSFKQFRYIP